MATEFKDMTSTVKWRLLVQAARVALESEGYELERVPGRGRSNIWDGVIDGECSRISIRTTQDRYIAFPPLDDGKSWKTLDQVDQVAVATVRDWSDSPDIDVYLFEADFVRQHFNEAYSARKAEGKTITDDFGMWVGLDIDDSVGSGIAIGKEPIATFQVTDLIGNDENSEVGNEPDHDNESVGGRAPTIAEVLDRTCHTLSTIAGVPVGAIKLECKITY